MNIIEIEKTSPVRISEPNGDHPQDRWLIAPGAQVASPEHDLEHDLVKGYFANLARPLPKEGGLSSKIDFPQTPFVIDWAPLASLNNRLSRRQLQELRALCSLGDNSQVRFVSSELPPQVALLTNIANYLAFSHFNLVQAINWRTSCRYNLPTSQKDASLFSLLEPNSIQGPRLGVYLGVIAPFQLLSSIKEISTADLDIRLRELPPKFDKVLAFIKLFRRQRARVPALMRRVLCFNKSFFKKIETKNISSGLRLLIQHEIIHPYVEQLVYQVLEPEDPEFVLVENLVRILELVEADDVPTRLESGHIASKLSEGESFAPHDVEPVLRVLNSELARHEQLAISHYSRCLAGQIAKLRFLAFWLENLDFLSGLTQSSLSQEGDLSDFSHAFVKNQGWLDLLAEIVRKLEQSSNLRDFIKDSTSKELGADLYKQAFCLTKLFASACNEPGHDCERHVIQEPELALLLSLLFANQQLLARYRTFLARGS